MVDYEVTVFTANCINATTLSNVFIKLVGTKGESEQKRLSSLWRTFAFIRGAVSSFTVSCPTSIGELVVIEINKQPFLFFPEDYWFLSKVTVKSPEGRTFTFPVYRWITNTKQNFREGKALRVFEDNHRSCWCKQQELEQRQKNYCWHENKKGLPHCMIVDDLHAMPSEVRFSFTKKIEFLFTLSTGSTEVKLKGLNNDKEKWKRLEDIKGVFFNRMTDISNYATKHWKEDQFFGYQFLNGVNPMMIRRCNKLPSNFPVTDYEVQIHGPSSLTKEIEKGNIFLCDYNILEGIETNTINGNKQYLMAPLVLLQKTPENQLMPIAIQLKQTQAEDNPIFLPSDSEYDWLLAKIFVRSADFNVHQLNFHLLRTHLLSEVFAVSLLRNVPMVHPLYKLVIPHTRYTLQINFLARERLISEDGSFTLFTASGGKGMFSILSRSLSTLTYKSLCIRDDITERGLEDVPNFYYRDDGFKLWDIVHKFVEGILRHYYKNNTEVLEDTELQKWIGDIFEHGFLSQEKTGILQNFTTVDELIKFVTMVIFTGSVQHAAVNSGQFDYGGWMPNTPPTLQLPPPTIKGKATKETMLNTLPDINTTVHGMASLWLLSKQSTDFVPFGHYPEDHFTEETPLKIIKNFQNKLKELSKDIQERNKKLDLPYKYLDPEEIENSVAI